MCQDMGLVLPLVGLVALGGNVSVVIITAGYDTLKKFDFSTRSLGNRVWQYLYETSLVLSTGCCQCGRVRCFLVPGGKH